MSATTDSVALEWPNEHKEVLYDRPEAVAAALSLLPPLRPFAIKISLVPRDAADQGNQEHIKVAEATVRAYLATILK
mgnify:CR=1 FL=1